MENIQIGIGEVVTLRNRDTYIVGEIVGLTVWEGTAEAIKIKDMDHWFLMADGWQAVIVEETE